MKTNSLKIPAPNNGLEVAIGEFESLRVISPSLPGSQQERELRQQEDYLLLPDTKTYPLTRRLVVIVPAGELDEGGLGMRIHKIAFPDRVSILFLSLASIPERDWALQRRLITLASLVKDRQIKTTTRLAFRQHWIQAIKEVWQAGDLLVCIEGYCIKTFFFRRTDLAPRIVSTLGVPVYVLTGIQLGSEPILWNRWREALIWVAAIALIVLFGLLQFSIDTTFEGTVSTLLLILSVIVEITLLWKLNFLG